MQPEPHREDGAVVSAHRSVRSRRGQLLRDVIPIWLALAAITTCPYLVALAKTPTGYSFSGVLSAYDDTFTYFAWMRQAADGRLLMCDLYTSEPQSCEFFLPLWICLGQIARVTRLPIPLVFHLARIASALLMLFAVGVLVRKVSGSRTRLRWTLWFYAFSGGLGWLVYSVKNHESLFEGAGVSGSVDLNLPEAFAFRSVFSQVHFALGTAMICGSIHLFSTALNEKRKKYAGWAGVLVSLLSVVHPYLVVVTLAVATVFVSAWPWLCRQASVTAYKSIFPIIVWFSGFSLPGLAYLLYLNRSNAVLREWLRITDTLSPNPLEYLLGFGIVALLAGFSLKPLLVHRKTSVRVTAVWIIVQILLLYAPVNFQRRLVEGLQVPLIIGASFALFLIASRMRWRRTSRNLVFSVVLLFSSITSIAFMIGQVVARGSATGATDPRRYLPGDLDNAMNWLRLHAEPDSVVICSYFTGNVLPGRTGLRVFLGHYGQTMYSQLKGAVVTRLFNNELPEAEAREILEKNGIRYLIAGPFERQISASFRAYSWLQLTETFGDVEIYAVNPAQN